MRELIDAFGQPLEGGVASGDVATELAEAGQDALVVAEVGGEEFGQRLVRGRFSSRASSTELQRGLPVYDR